MTLYRCFAWNDQAALDGPDGPLWFPRVFQGDGRHDCPARYGCLYLSQYRLSPVVEQLARFRGHPLGAGLLRRRGLPLALARLELAEGAALIDLDDPRVLAREALRPSQVATRHRQITQAQAAAVYERHARAAGLGWWSVHESTWLNVTLFDRAAAQLQLASLDVLAVDDPLVIEAAEWLGLS